MFNDYKMNVIINSVPKVFSHSDKHFSQMFKNSVKLVVT